MSPDFDQNVALILDFWFEEEGPKAWFVKDAALDARITERFADLYEAAAAGQFDHWQKSFSGTLALVILLDQFPRNMFRDSPRAFAADDQALEVARRALAAGHDMALDPDRRKFLYMPFQHSENIDDQKLSVRLVAERCRDEKTLDFAQRHLDVIARFGRFPHRNGILGRPSTPEEAAYLAEPDAGF